MFLDIIIARFYLLFKKTDLYTPNNKIDKSFGNERTHRGRDVIENVARGTSYILY